MIETMFCFRTKWKRQTAVGIELLTEAGNVAALQQMYRGLGYSWPVNHPSLPTLPTLPSISPLSTLDLYYRHAAAAHSLQRPFPYKMLPGGAGTPLPPSPHPPHPPVFHSPGILQHPSLHPLPHLPPLSLPAASAALQEMSSDRSRSPESPRSTRSPPLRSPTCRSPVPGTSSPPLSLVASPSPPPPR